MSLEVHREPRVPRIEQLPGDQSPGVEIDLANRRSSGRRVPLLMMARSADEMQVWTLCRDLGYRRWRALAGEYGDRPMLQASRAVLIPDPVF